MSPKDCTGLLEWQQRLVYLGGCDPLEQDSFMVCELLEIVGKPLRIYTVLGQGPVLGAKE